MAEISYTAQCALDEYGRWIADVLEEQMADRKTENSSEKPNNCDTCKHNKLEWYSEICDSCCGNNNHYEPKDEPTGYNLSPVDKDINVRSKDEPQSDCEDAWRAGYKTGYDKGFRDAQKVNDSRELVKDLVDDEFNPYDEECMRCKHLKLKCEFIPTYCKFESKDEPQTERKDK